MGMISVFWQASQQQIDDLSNLPVWEVEEKAGDLFHEKLEEKNECDIDKAWDGLNYIFGGSDQTNEDSTECFILAGNILGKIDIESDGCLDLEGQSIFRWYTIEQVAEISLFLNSWDRDKLRAKYDPLRMDGEGIYPTCFVSDPEGMFEYIYEKFTRLCLFFQSVSDAKGYVVTFIG